MAPQGKQDVELILTELPLDHIVWDDASHAPDPRMLYSLRQYGQLDPIHARAGDNGCHEVLLGEECVAGGRALGWKSLSAIVETEAADDVPGELRALALEMQRES